jgi:C-terminal processing protease CtpA/Prc
VRTLSISALLLAASLAPAAAPAQEARRDDGPDPAVSPELRAQVINGVLKKIQEAYVFPDVAKKMEAAVRDRVARKEYDGVTTARQLARALTEHLQEVSRDKHLRVSYVAEGGPRALRRDATPEERERMRQMAAARNFGFEKAERLEGNVGYLDLRGFMPPEVAGETAAAAMNFLANADALILDLRKNGGGDPAMVALLCSYLFPADPVVHLNDLYFRPDDSTHQWWTLPYVPGKRFVGKPVYVLTSRRTFSAAEECAYNLKNLKRATLVGETTGGGAHPGGVQPVADKFFVFVPSGRAINPVSKTNWEGTGVTPDVDVPADQALKAAHLAALQALREKQKADPQAVRRLDEAIEAARKELDGLKAKAGPPASGEGPRPGARSPGNRPRRSMSAWC